MNQGSARFKYLDGLRGIACLTVVAYHYIHHFIVPQNFYDTYMNHPAIGVFSNGRLAIFLFFLISGFVLTKSSFGKPGSFGRMLLARAIRLWVPTGAAVLIAFFAFYQGKYAAHFEALQTGLTGILTGYNDRSLFDARWVPTADNPAFSPFWTISVELIGSVLIFALAAAQAYSRIVYRVALVAIALALGDNELQLFIVGHLCARWNRFEATSPWRSAIGTIGFLLAFGATALWPATLFRSGPDIGWFCVPLDFNLTLAVCAVFMFLCLAKSRCIIATLESWPMQFLGRISFPIYLLHMSVIVTFGTWLTSRHLSPLIIAPACLMMIIGLADLFERGLDAPMIALSRRVKHPNGGLRFALWGTPRR